MGIPAATAVLAGVDDALSIRWRREGWLHLHAFFSPDQVRAIDDVVDALWLRRPRQVIVDDLDRNQRLRMSRVTSDSRTHRLKINDLYLTEPAVRELLLDRRLIELVTELLGDAAVLCNSLNLERSSAQHYHADSLFMTPETPGRLVACWIALEDVSPGSGPLRLYPGSHLFPRYRFSGGSAHAIASELPQWGAQMQREIDGRGMQPHVIHARCGDVVVWHGDLLHGAEEIRDAAATRRSMIAHYFSRDDCEQRGYQLAGERGRWWLRRRSQPVDLRSRVAAAVERRVWRLRAAARALRNRLR